jgi:ATP-binding cassette subfamily D (ALD) protein 3
MFQHLVRQVVQSRTLGLSALGVLVVVIFLFNYRNKKLERAILARTQRNSNRAKGKKSGRVDFQFLQNLSKIVGVAFPSLFSSLTFDMTAMIISLVLRTFLSIYIAAINGTFVRAIVDRNLSMFVRKIGKLMAIAVPASVLNSYLDYLRKSIAYRIRDNLTHHFHSVYMEQMRFYQVSNIDGRIENVDQRLTNDIEKFSMAFSSLFSNFTKPVLDIFLFGRALAQRVGYKTISLTFIWYFISGFIIKLVAPPLGLMTAVQQDLEGSYRAQHANIATFCQEIAFSNGGKFEKQKLKEKYDEILRHEESMLFKRLWLGCFDGMLVKYGATMVASYVLAKPSMDNFKMNENRLSVTELTQDYIRNGSLMFNLAKSIGRLVISYKDLQNMAGYTALISDFQTVLRDLEAGRYVRQQIDNTHQYRKNITQASFDMKSRGAVVISEDDSIFFDKVPLITPTGDFLVESVTFTLKRGENLIISGPNGCGKSSLFRVLGGLWPIMGGRVGRPPIECLFYLPQRPYVPEGTLREQIIYPEHIVQESLDDQEMLELLRFMGLEDLIGDKGVNCLKEFQDWEQVLSGGEKQLVAMTRLLYHRPKFAILDECTSLVSLEMEAKFYNRAKEIGVSLFTISHRPSLFKYHDFYLKFDGEGNYEYIDLRKEPEEQKRKHGKSFKEGEDDDDEVK